MATREELHYGSTTSQALVVTNNISFDRWTSVQARIDASGQNTVIGGRIPDPVDCSIHEGDVVFYDLTERIGPAQQPRVFSNLSAVITSTTTDKKKRDEEIWKKIAIRGVARNIISYNPMTKKPINTQLSAATGGTHKLRNSGPGKINAHEWVFVKVPDAFVGRAVAETVGVRPENIPDIGRTLDFSSVAKTNVFIDAFADAVQPVFEFFLLLHSKDHDIAKGKVEGWLHDPASYKTSNLDDLLDSNMTHKDHPKEKAIKQASHLMAQDFAYAYKRRLGRYVRPVKPGPSANATVPLNEPILAGNTVSVAPTVHGQGYITDLEIEAHLEKEFAAGVLFAGEMMSRVVGISLEDTPSGRDLDCMLHPCPASMLRQVAVTK